MNKTYFQDFPDGLVVKTPFLQWRRKCQPTPVFLPGKSQTQRSLAGYSLQGCKELDMTEHACTSKARNRFLVGELRSTCYSVRPKKLRIKNEKTDHHIMIFKKMQSQS